MSKILIVDDRTERKKNFLSDKEIEMLSKQSVIKSAMHTESSNDILNEFADYNLIAIHRSWLQELGGNIENEIKEIATKEHKHLILFSGGIDQKLLINEYVAIINSADFYSNRLIDFIKKNTSSNLNNPLLYFLYGESWRLSLWIELRSIYWKSNNKIDESNETIIDNILTILQEESSPEDWDVEKITEKINNEKYI